MPRRDFHGSSICTQKANNHFHYHRRVNEQLMQNYTYTRSGHWTKRLIYLLSDPSVIWLLLGIPVFFSMQHSSFWFQLPHLKFRFSLDPFLSPPEMFSISTGLDSALGTPGSCLGPRAFCKQRK